ncbi:MAG: hypothetical protein HKO57_02805, partial [Akkermansiaceae bacterium]|nr:hypothetical protein [Akkermansiaceae bacterium]
RCILRNGDKELWTKKCVAKTPTTVTLEGGYEHILDGDVLKIEARYEAKRRR